MKSPLKQRAQKPPFLLLVLVLSALWTTAPRAERQRNTEVGPDLAPPPVFQYPGPAAKAVVILSQPASYELPMRDASTEMKAHASCSAVEPGVIEVSLSWSTKRLGAEAYRIDITDLGDGFATGRYLTSGERETSVKELPFESARAGVYYYWRLLTKTTDGWVVSGTGRFDAPTCPVDEGEEEGE
jgi:hypothetical protein